MEFYAAYPQEVYPQAGGCPGRGRISLEQTAPSPGRVRVPTKLVSVESKLVTCSWLSWRSP